MLFVRTLRDWVRNHDRRTDLRWVPHPYTHALDCRGRGRTLRRWDSVGGKGDAPERSRGIEVSSVRHLHSAETDTGDAICETTRAVQRKIGLNDQSITDK